MLNKLTHGLVTDSKTSRLPPGAGRRLFLPLVLAGCAWLLVAPPRSRRWRLLAALCLAMAVGGPAWGQEFGLTGIAPASGPLAGGTTVTITGNLFTGATHVMFGPSGAYSDAPSFQVVDDQHIVAVTPPGSGTVPVGVGYPSMGTWHGGVTFTYLPPGLTGPATNLLVRQGTLFNPGLITAVGATPPYQYTLTTGSLPAGIELVTSGDSCYFYGTTLAARGSYPVTLSFTDSLGRVGSQSYTLFVWTNQTASVTTLATSPTPAQFGQTVTLTATVSAPASGGWTPTGKVVFRDNGQLLGTATLSGGLASVSTPALGVGSRTITAEYWGDGYVRAGTGAAQQTVNPPATLYPNLGTRGAYFRLGETDGYLINGENVLSTEDDYSTGALIGYGPEAHPYPCYTNDVAPGAVARTGSSWSVSFVGNQLLQNESPDTFRMSRSYGVEA